MSLAAESPSPSSPSSSSGSDDFAVLLDAELELTSAADSASAGDPSAATDDDDEGGDEEEEDVVVVVEQEDAIVEQSRYAPLRTLTSSRGARSRSSWVWRRLEALGGSVLLALSVLDGR
jgi:hypothetical protein